MSFPTMSSVRTHRALDDVGMPIRCATTRVRLLGPWEVAVRPDWLLDEVDSAGRENLDAEHVALYDAREDADAAAEVELCRDLGLADDWHVVDLGAGTGQFALAAARHYARVVAVDVSPVMRAQLTRRITDAGLGNVEVVAAGFLTYEHDAPPADLVYSRYALHHLPDAWKAVALARIHDLLRPGGLLRLWDVVYDVEPHEFPDRMEDWAAAFPTDPQRGAWGRADVAEHVRDEHSTFTWVLEPMLERAGFTLEAVERSGDGIFARYVARRVRDLAAGRTAQSMQAEPLI